VINASSCGVGFFGEIRIIKAFLKITKKAEAEAAAELLQS
jgi:hypothetical protein